MEEFEKEYYTIEDFMNDYPECGKEDCPYCDGSGWIRVNEYPIVLEECECQK